MKRFGRRTSLVQLADKRGVRGSMRVPRVVTRNVIHFEGRGVAIINPWDE